jgi:antitoxin component YwqK of YwqJK toxin-antitoxin module
VKKIFIVFISLFLLNHLSGQEVLQKDGKYFGADGKLYTGVFKEFDEKGNVLTENNVNQGILDGITLLYYNSGAKKEQRSYLKGKKDGLWINWNENGVKTAEARFTDGKKDGFWYIWDEKGTKRYEMFYKEGQKKGTWYIWDETGKLITEQKYD